MFNYIKYNLRLLLKQRTYRFVFFLLMVLSIALPIYYTVEFWGSYNYVLPSADTLYIGNGGGILWALIEFLFPFLILLPYSLSFVKESKSGALLYVQIRGNRKKYYFSQVIVCFIGTFFAFLIPLLTNILLNSVLFPVTGNDYVSSYNYYDANWSNTIVGIGFWKQQLTPGYIFKEMAITHPQFYNILFAVFMSWAAGIMAVFAYAISLVLHRKAVYLMIASYFYFTTFSIIDKIVERSSQLYINTNLITYLSNGHFNRGLVYLLYIIWLLVELCISYFVITSRIKGDEL